MGNIDVYDGGSYTQYTEQIEAGGGGALICEVDMTTLELNHTWKEIADAKNAILVMPQQEGSYGYAYLTGSDSYDLEGEHICQLVFIYAGDVEDGLIGGQKIVCACGSENDYPTVNV